MYSNEFNTWTENGEWSISNDFLKVINNGVAETGCFVADVVVRNILENNDYGSLSVEGVTYSSGDTAYLPPGYNYSFETYHNFQNGNNLFRDWQDQYYENPKSILINQNQEIASHFYLTHPLTVTNNLEGGEGGSWQVKWDKEATYEDPIVSGDPFNAFEYNTQLLDRYTIKAEALDNVINTDWQFQYWGTDPDDDSSVKSGIEVHDETSFTANYKGHFRSQSADAFTSNSQRKLVRTDDGIYHMVYESMGYVWYTTSQSSTFSGSWDFEQLIVEDDLYNYGLNPSVDYICNTVVVAFENKYVYETGTDYKIDMAIIENGVINGQTVATINSTDYGSCKPVISIDPRYIMVAWEDPTAGVFKYALWNRSTSSWQTTATTIPNSNSSAHNLSIASYKGTGGITTYVYMAWQYNTNNIKYQQYYHKGGDIQFKNFQTISVGSGCTINYNPSVAVYGNTPIISWTGRKKIFGAGYDDKAVIRSDPENGSSFFTYGTTVDYTNCNTAGTGETVITISENDGNNCVWMRRDPTNTYTWDDLSHDGIQTQVSNAADLEDMRAVTFDDDNLPYVINKSTNDFSEGGLSKTATVTRTSYSRQGVICKNDIEFIFNMEDIFLDEQPVSFIDFPDTNKISTIADLNAIARSNTMYLTSSSNLLFSHYYGVINDSLAQALLNEDDHVNFKIQLIKESNDLLIAEIDAVNYNKNNLDEYGIFNYQLDCSGIQPDEYYLRLATEVSGDAQYNLGSGIKSIDAGLGKKGYQTLRFSEINIPLTYTLEQNHPNPFNPTTVINYQIEQTGHVQLKVYDVTGREVKTLVDAEKAAGRYQTQFDGSGLASGVYIYKMISGKFVTQKKMLLVK